ncbi:MAG: 2Fe-2S ferredoxin [Acidiferrobacteraceae bacterium]|nr:2Fe-2S ferredoxin [Acidiferrobacteraceae bacterium]|tara:strand:+ start:469 stop:1572 length:1104 start_codon:yes stop_codon:yes gene_type:complete
MKGLANRYYDNKEDFLVERAKIFAPMWVCIGFASDAPLPGYVYRVEFMELPLIIVRDYDNAVHVFHNVCRHRGHILVTESGELGASLRCPYHSWTYALNGSLMRTPHIGGLGIHDCEAFERNEAGLISVDCRVWNDLLFINLDGSADSFEKFIHPLEERWSRLWGTSGSDKLRRHEDFQPICFDIDANWKLAIENYLEAYHLPTVHSELNRVSPMQDHDIQVAEQFAGQVSHCYQLGAESENRLPIFPDWPSPLLTEADYPALFPNTLLGLQADHLFVMVVIPIHFNQIREETRLYFVGDESLTLEYETLRQEQAVFWRHVFEEDVSVVTGMQKGRASSGFDGGILSPVQDRATQAFHEWVSIRLGI